MDLYTQQNYLLDIDYLFDTTIREYDMSQANINALLYTGRINYDEYSMLRSVSKMDREKYIGLKIRSDISLYKSIQEGIIEAKRLLITNNNIASADILAIKNDAVFLINKAPKVVEFNMPRGALFKFNNKNVYSTYIRLKTKRGKLEIYYMYDVVNDKDVLEIKGITKTLYLHQEYFCDFLSAVLYAGQMMGVESAIEIIRNFYLEYISLNLDIGFYRSFDSISQYDFKNIGYSSYGSLYMPNSIEVKRMLDISFNLDIIRKLYSIFVNRYFSKRTPIPK